MLVLFRLQDARRASCWILADFCAANAPDDISTFLVYAPTLENSLSEGLWEEPSFRQELQ